MSSHFLQTVLICFDKNTDEEFGIFLLCNYCTIYHSAVFYWLNAWNRPCFSHLPGWISFWKKCFESSFWNIWDLENLQLSLTLQLPWVTKTEFLLTISIQYQADEWWEYRQILIWGLLVDPIPNSLNQHHKNCVADSKENYWWDLRSWRVN